METINTAKKLKNYSNETGFALGFYGSFGSSFVASYSSHLIENSDLSGSSNFLKLSKYHNPDYLPIFA